MPTYGYEEYLRIVRPLPEQVRRDIYDIPVIENNPIDISELKNGISLINLNNISINDRRASQKIVHCFSNDDVLRRKYNHPMQFLHQVSQYLAVATFDFSMTPGMKFPQMLNAIHANRWSGAFLQCHGKKVLATVGWTTPEFYDLCFAGLTNGAVMLISTLSTHNASCEKIFIDGYRELRRRFPDSSLICVGDRFADMDSDVCFIPYEETFGNRDRYQNWWQPSLINWDMSLAAGGEK